MADIVGTRYNIKTEDVIFRSSVSEAVGNKLGAAVNFINTKQTDSKLWYLNGNYSSSPNTIGVDGAYICEVDMEIYFVGMYNLIAGSAGSTEFDLFRHTSSGVGGGSIFSSKPSLPFSAGNNAYLAKRFFDNTILENPAGCVQPVLISANLDAGDMITCNLTGVQVDGQNAGIILNMRPR